MPKLMAISRIKTNAGARIGSSAVGKRGSNQKSVSKIRKEGRKQPGNNPGLGGEVSPETGGFQPESLPRGAGWRLARPRRHPARK
jgi:hypothetical protein